MSRESPRAARRSARTSGPAYRMRSLLRSRLVRALGLRPGRSSRSTSRPERSPSPERDRRTRRATQDVETVETTTATTEVASLPGLETVPGVTPEVRDKPEHWIERGPQKRLMLFSGRSHPVLAEKIGERLGVELGAITLGSFANGETYCRFEESIRGAD